MELQNVKSRRLYHFRKAKSECASSRFEMKELEHGGPFGAHSRYRASELCSSSAGSGRGADDRCSGTQRGRVRDSGWLHAAARCAERTRRRLRALVPFLKRGVYVRDTTRRACVPYTYVRSNTHCSRGFSSLWRLDLRSSFLVFPRYTRRRFVPPFRRRRLFS